MQEEEYNGNTEINKEEDAEWPSDDVEKRIPLAIPTHGYVLIPPCFTSFW